MSSESKNNAIAAMKTAMDTMEAMALNLRDLNAKLGAVYNEIAKNPVENPDDVERREIPIEEFRKLKMSLISMNKAMNLDVKDPFSQASIKGFNDAVDLACDVNNAGQLFKVNPDVEDGYELVNLDDVEISVHLHGVVRLNGNCYTNSALYLIFNFVLQHNEHNPKEKKINDEDSDIQSCDLRVEGDAASNELVTLSACIYKNVLYLCFSRLFDMGVTKCKIELGEYTVEQKMQLLEAMSYCSASLNKDFKVDID